MTARLLPRALAALAFTAVAGAANAVMFSVTVTNLGPQPLAPVFYATSNSSFDIFTNGTAASSAIEMEAEEGSPAGLLSLASGAGANVMSFGATTGPFMTGESRTFTINADTSHPWFQFASMLGITNDGFMGSAVGVGDNQIDLFQGGQPLTANFTVSFLNIWDAGTEVNSELMAHVPPNTGAGTAEGGVIRSPHEGITGRGDIPTSLDWYGHDVARITIAAVPEPGTIAALALGIGVLLRRRSKK
jgi:hypothetical protein